MGLKSKILSLLDRDWCEIGVEEKLRARSQSHAIDYGYEVIDDITLVRTAMHPALAENISDGELSLTTWFLSVTI